MSFTVHDVDQRSPEWWALRAGLVTGSCAPALVAVRKRGSGELAIRRDLRRVKACERLTGRPQEPAFFRTPDAVQHGIETEPDAVAAYAAATGQIVQRVGFVSRNDLKAGCSPDGFVGEWEGIVEVKCPNSTTHLEYLKANVVPEGYEGQLIHSLWVTGARWADFVSFDPRFHEPRLRLFIKRMRREEVDITAYELAVRLFLSEVDKEVAELLGPVAVGA